MVARRRRWNSVGKGTAARHNANESGGKGRENLKKGSRCQWQYKTTLREGKTMVVVVVVVERKLQ